MDYDCRLINPKTGEVEKLQGVSPSARTYAGGPSNASWTSITSNYSDHFKRVFRNDDGIKVLHGVPGYASIPVLFSAIFKLRNFADDDHLKPTEGNVKWSLIDLVWMAATFPDNVWEISQGGEKARVVSNKARSRGQTKRVTVRTLTGREIEIIPDIKPTSAQAVARGEIKKNEWIIIQGCLEALACGDRFNFRLMAHEDPRNFPTASQEGILLYLFGETNPVWQAETGKRMRWVQEFY